MGQPASASTGSDIPRVETPPRAVDRPGDVSPFALGLLLRRAHDRAARALAEAVHSQGIELRHFAVLITLIDRGPLNQRDLSEASGMDKAGIVRAVDDLERLGYANRRLAPEDRRIRIVEVTAEGQAAFDAAHVNADDIAVRLVAHLEPGEPELLMDILTRFTYPPD